MPGTAEITNKLLQGDWHANSDSAFYPGHNSHYWNEPATRCQEFLKILKDQVDRYYRLTGRKGEGNYEDMYYLARQIADDELREINNPAIYDFSKRIKSNTRRLRKQLLSDADNLTIERLADVSCNFILWVVRRLLENPKELKGLNSIRKIAQSVQFQRIDIFTLNHDCLIEALLNELLKEFPDITFTDGFEDKPNGNIRFYKPILYDEKRKIRLFKLHGSINWFRLRTSIEGREIECYAIPLGDRSDNDSMGNRWSTIEPPIILTGTYNKVMDYASEIFADMYFHFHQALRRNNIMVMSGYGWNDYGLNKRLIEWLQSSTQRRLYLCHKQPQDIRDKSKSGMRGWYDDFVKDGRLIPIPKWPSDMNSQEIESLIGEICNKHCHQSDSADDMGHQTVAYTGANQ